MLRGKTLWKNFVEEEERWMEMWWLDSRGKAEVVSFSKLCIK